MSASSWVIAIAVVALLAVVAFLRLRGGRGEPGTRRTPLPSDWALTPRPVFSGDERRIFRALLEALPDHIVLAKLPLVRFCYPSDPNRVRYWYDLLGSVHVAFAICTVNGRIVAAVDVESGRRGTGRTLQIKQAVLSACRIRYLRLAPDAQPTTEELRMLVPPPAPRSPRNLQEARSSLASTVASRRAARSAATPSGWHDSTSFPDSFFAPDTRIDAFAASGFGMLAPAGPSSRFDDARSDDDIVGVVVENRTPPQAAAKG